MQALETRKARILRIFNNQHFHSTPCSLWISPRHVRNGHVSCQAPAVAAGNTSEPAGRRSRAGSYECWRTTTLSGAATSRARLRPWLFEA